MEVKKKQKIMIIHHSGLLGGAGVSLYNVLKEFNDTYDIVYYIPNNPIHLYNFMKERDLNPKTFDFRLGKIPYYSGGEKILNPKFWYHSLHGIFQVKYWKNIIFIEKPDLIMVNSRVLSWMVTLFGNTKSICFVRETVPIPKNKIIDFVMRSFLDRFSAVIYISNYDLNKDNLKKAKTSVVYDFLNSVEYYNKISKKDACNKLKINNNTFNVLFVGGVNNLKGIDIAIDAFKYIRDKDINLIVAGDSAFEFKKSIKNFFVNRKKIDFAKKIKSDILNSNLKDIVKFIGVQKNMSLVYSACDILIFPMKKPHQSRPIFEIGIQKKTFIISDYPNTEEFLENGRRGLIFNVNDPKSLANSIIKLKNNPKLTQKMGIRNYEFSINKHNKENSIRILKEVVEDILEIK